VNSKVGPTEGSGITIQGEKTMWKDQKGKNDCWDEL